MYSMRSAGPVGRFLQDSEGGVLVEFTLVFPVLLLVALGTVDFTYMLFDWSMADKAAFVGARRAVVLDPLATGITDLTYSTAGTQLNRPCFDTSGAVDITGNCHMVSTVCPQAAHNVS